MNYYYSNDYSDDGRFTPSEVIDAFRGYWQRHALWVRAYIDNLISGSPNTVYINERIVENALAFADTICLFYGDTCDIGELLISRFKVSQNLLYSIMIGDEAAARQAADEWLRLSALFAERLAELNPYLSITELLRLLGEQLAVIEAEMRFRLTQRGPYRADFPEADLVAREIADYLALGVIRQFGLQP